MNPQKALPPEGNQGEDIPANWKIHPLFHVLKAVDMRQRSEKIQSDTEYKLLTVKLYAKGITLRSQVKGHQIGVSKLYRTQPGDFVVSKIDARNGAWGFVPRELIGGMVSNDFPIFRLDPSRADPDYLTFMLSQPSSWQPLLEQAIGSTGRRRVQADHFLRLEFLFPPLDEQQAIATALRASKAAIDATANALAQTHELKRSLMRYLFTYGPVQVNDAIKVELQETEIGEMPREWEVLTLGDLGKVGNGSTPKRDNTTFWVGGKYPWINSGKVNEGVIRRADQFVTDQALKECHLPKVPPKSLLVAITGQGKTLGTAAITKIEATVNQHVAYVAFKNPDLHAEYTYQYLKTRYSDLRAAGGAGGSTKAALTCAFIKKYPVPIPSDEEIKLITDALRAMDDRIDRLTGELEVQRSLMNSLLHNLMAGQIHVVLKPGLPEEVTA